MPRVRSSAIAAIDYNEAARELYITFRESGKYTYYGVPKHIYEAFLSASSKGRFFNNQIKDRY